MMSAFHCCPLDPSGIQLLATPKCSQTVQNAHIINACQLLDDYGGGTTVHTYEYPLNTNDTIWTLPCAHELLLPRTVAVSSPNKSDTAATRRRKFDDKIRIFEQARGAPSGDLPNSELIIEEPYETDQIARLDIVIRGLKSRRNELASISRLPPDVLFRVFAFCSFNRNSDMHRMHLEVGALGREK